MATVLITGANRGIGLELARQYVARGDRVLAVCRATSQQLDALGATVLAGVDVTSADDVAALAGRVGDARLDVLIHNAGILRGDALDTVDVAAVRACFEVNSLAPLCVTRALLPALSDGAKVAIITSRMGSIDDNTSGRFYAYRMSKAAVNIAGKSLAVDLAPRGVAVAILHPGAVRTQMTGGHGDVEPAHAAAGLIARIDELSLDTTGRFRHANGEDLPW